MDMQVDAKLIKTERERRAWSQEHLAAAAGLGLRTVQRIEKTGAASYESARALAAVLGVDVAALRAVLPRRTPGPSIRVPLRPALAALAALLAGGALFIASQSFAEQVLLDVGVALNTTNDTREWLTQMVVDEGTLVPNVNDLRLEDLRFSIVPRVLPDGKILLQMQIFEHQGDNEVLVTAPKLVTADGQKAEVVVGTEARSFRFSITPKRQPSSLLPHR